MANTQLKNWTQKQQGVTPFEDMKVAISNGGIQAILRDLLGENAPSFATSLMELYSSTGIRDCDANLVIKEAMKAATMRLPIDKNLGFAYIVPYFNKKTGKKEPQFQLGYRGYIQLAMRSGKYKTINANILYEGMKMEEDYLSGNLKIGGERTSDKPIGYFAYFQLINGFEKALYWDKEKVTAHAQKYSQSYGKAASPWKEHFDEMALKTVLKRLLSKYGVLSIEMQNAIMEEADEVVQVDIDNHANAIPFQEEPRQLQETVDPETGEIIDSKQSDFLGEDFQPIDEAKAPF